MKELHLTSAVAGSPRPLVSRRARRSLLLASLSFSALLTIMAPVTVHHGLHIAFNQAWADSEGGDGGQGGDGGEGDGGDDHDNTGTGGDHTGSDDAGDNDHGANDNGDDQDEDNGDDQDEDNGDDQDDDAGDQADNSDDGTADQGSGDVPPPVPTGQ